MYHLLPKAGKRPIFSNKFPSANLYKFRHLQGRDDKDRDKNVISKISQTRLTKVTGICRGFAANREIWYEAFSTMQQSRWIPLVPHFRHSTILFASFMPIVDISKKSTNSRSIVSLHRSHNWQSYRHGRMKLASTLDKHILHSRPRVTFQETGCQFTIGRRHKQGRKKIRRSVRTAAPN